MDTVTQSDVRSLVTTNGECCVSIYMPTHLLGREGVQDSVRIKNLVAAAERQLVAGGMRTGGAKEFLEPISDLPIQSDWERRKTGLAIFRSKDSMSHYHLSNPFEETLVVGRQFYVKPLLPIVSKNHQFFVLAISRNQVRLLKATSDGYERLELPGLPNNIEQGLNLQTADRGEQVHSGGIRGDLGKEAAVFHGQGGHRDTIKDEVVEYCRLINESLQPLLRQTSWPLILAGVDYELAMYREASSIRTLPRNLCMVRSTMSRIASSTKRPCRLRSGLTTQKRQ